MQTLTQLSDEVLGSGNNGSPAEFVCMDSTPDPTGAGCGAHGGLWTPDLRKHEPSPRMAIMVKV